MQAIFKHRTRDPRTLSNEELKASWRSREAHLLRLLSAKNLDSIKGSFDMLTNGEEGLSGPQFISILLKLFGHIVVDREEFAISGMELFNAIDVSCPENRYLWHSASGICYYPFTFLLAGQRRQIDGMGRTAGVRGGDCHSERGSA
jgi:hypothetical protein